MNHRLTLIDAGTGDQIMRWLTACDCGWRSEWSGVVTAALDAYSEHLPATDEHPQEQKQ